MKIKSEYKKLWGNCLKKIQSSVSEQALKPGLALQPLAVLVMRLPSKYQTGFIMSGLNQNIVKS